MKLYNSLVFFLGFSFSLSAAAQSLDFHSYLQQVKMKNRNLLSLQAGLEAVSGRYAQDNLVLSPVLIASVKQLDDKASSFTAPTLTRLQAQEYSLGIAKSFTTGTQVQIAGQVQETKLDFSGATPAQQIGQGSLSLALSQSLWKNFFGSATRLRLQREDELRNLEDLAQRLKLEQALIEAEHLFWDVLAGEDELNIRKTSLERARRIESWVSNRVSNGIGDKADLYNAKGLVAARELQLLQSQDAVLARQKSLRQMLELTDSEKTPSLMHDLTVSSVAHSMSGKNQGAAKVRMDSYLNYLESRVKLLASNEVVDGMRPDLTLEGQYKTNGYDSSLSGATKEISKTDKPTQAVALKLTWILDDGTKTMAVNTAKADALAARLKSERSLSDSTDSYEELIRRNEELGKMIKVAGELAKLQLARAAAEREKLSKGRSITSQVITAEQEAAEAELSLTNLLAQQKKLESQFRLFMERPEGV